MKNSKPIRLLALFCTLVMVFSLFAGCKKDTETADGEESGTISTDLDGMPQEAIDYLPEQQDMGGYEYRMVVQNSSEDHLQYYLSKEGLSGDAVSIALYTRQLFLEEYFNITMKVTSEEASTISTRINTVMLADEDLWDVCVVVAGRGMKGNVIKGDFLDMFQLDGLNLNTSYWDQNIQEAYAIEGMLFCLEGDFTILDELRTHGVLYNAKIYEDLGYNEKYGSPYELVSSGKWTYDTMLEMFKGTSSNSTGTMTKDDRWGMISETAAPHVFLLGSGASVARSVNGNMQLLFDDETQYNTIYNTLDYILKTLFVQNTEVLFTDASNGVLSSASEVYYRESATMFMQDKALFRNSTLLDATWLSDMTSRFGILPVPKFSEDQEEYHCWTSSMAHAPLSIPRTVYSHDHVDKTVAITEAMCYFSRYTIDGTMSLYESFYEKMTVAKLCQTSDDYKMLELIYASKTFDIDSAFNFTGLINVGISVISGKQSGNVNATYDTLSSTMTGLRDSASVSCTDAVNQILTNTIKIEK